MKVTEWLKEQDPIAAVIAWDIITRKVSLKTVNLAKAYLEQGNKYRTYIGVIAGSNPECFYMDETEDIAYYAMTELLEEADLE